MLLWPYDELTVSKGQSASEFLLKAPWLSLVLNVEEQDQERTAAIAAKIQAGSLSPEDRFDLTWLLKPLAALPVAYILPRAPDQFAGNDSHSVVQPPQPISAEWTWDQEGTLRFCQTAQGYDPLSILSVARRFHFLDLLQANPLAEAMALIETMKGDPEKHRMANALIVRQNHYVTVRCDGCLRPALGIALNAASEVREFMDQEKGHDRLLEKALRSIAPDPASVPVLPATQLLMDLLEQSATRNFLGFALAVDIFERATYSEQDPLAAFLAKGGYDRAAKQIDVHKKINDSGGHENVSLELLGHMAPVDRAYAIEALQLAEAVSQSVQSLSAQILVAVKAL